MSACYDPKAVTELARQGRVIATKHVTEWLANHGYDASEQLVEVLTSLVEAGRFHKSSKLKNGETADIYYVDLEDSWYLKFWVDQEQLIVDVLSCCWDGAVH